MKNVSGRIRRVKARGTGAAAINVRAPAFSILINANNELFSVWLGARGSAAPRGNHHLVPCTNDRCHPRRSSLRRIPFPATSPGSSRLYPRPLATLPIANHRAGSTAINKRASRYRFRWNTCLSPFFSPYVADLPSGSFSDDNPPPPLFL